MRFIWAAEETQRGRRAPAWSTLRHRFWFVPGLAALVTTAEMREFDGLYEAMSEEEIAYFLTQTKGAGALWYLALMRARYGIDAK